jgi:outer membrane protein
MTARILRTAVALYLVAWMAVGLPAWAQAQAQQQSQPPAQQSQSTTAQPSAAQASYLNMFQGPNYSKGKPLFPNPFSAYSPMRIPLPELLNSPTLLSMIHDGKLELSLNDAIGLALQNSLDIQVQRYLPWFAQTDLLSTEGGGTPQGQFTLGTGGGGAFDPVLFSTVSISDAISPPFSRFANAGQSHSDQYNFGYQQAFHTGTSMSVTFQNSRTSASSNFANNFNPSLTNTLSFNISQPLLRGFGLLPNTRFILEAKNENKQDELLFEEQVITTVTAVENQYWLLVFTRENVKVQQAALTSDQKLYQDNKRQLEIGTLAPLDVLTAESAVATDQQNLIVAQTNQLQQQAVLLNLISKNPMDPALQGVEIIPTTTAQDIPQVPTIDLADAVKEAWSNRPELKYDQLTLNTDDIEMRATRNSLLPSLTLSGTYSSTSLGGISTTSTPTGLFAPNTAEPVVDSTGAPVPNQFLPIPLVTTITSATGLGDNYSTIFHNDFPTYAASLSFSLPIRNRSAQAANARAQLNDRQALTAYQRDRNTIAISVRNALTAIEQGQAQVAAAAKATQLAQQTLTDEQKKYQLGASTSYNVVLRTRDLTAAEGNELQARINLETALVNFNQAMGRTLSSNRISIANNFDPQASPQPLIPGTLNGHLAKDTYGSFGISSLHQ